MIEDVVVNLGLKGDVNVDILDDDDTEEVAAGAFKKTRAGGN